LCITGLLREQRQGSVAAEQQHEQHSERPAARTQRDLGFGAMIPCLERHLVDPVEATRAPALLESLQQLDVEAPARAERCVQCVAQRGRGTEQLRTALRVVHRQPEHDGGQRREGAAHEMSRTGPIDVSTQHPDPRTHYHVDLRVRLEYRGELGDDRQRRRQVGIPVSHDRRTPVERRAHPASDGFRLATVGGQRDHRRARRGGGHDPVQHGPGLIAAAIIDEEQGGAVRLCQKAAEGVVVEALFLVVARNDDAGNGHAVRSRVRVRRRRAVRRRATTTAAGQPVRRPAGVEYCTARRCTQHLIANAGVASRVQHPLMKHDLRAPHAQADDAAASR
jgi:hypothetical protein